ncbi:spermidine/putrescine ABC transporter ATP-binding protein [Mycolicibacterium porcinum]|nr:spermidine/putrescine ABC transporter ATP-binding protein [Mycolicibacterium porcinum]
MPVTSRSEAAGSSRKRSSAPPVLLRGVSKRYGATTAVSNLDLEVQRAEVLALLGPNGAGKTTTVEMCEGFIRSDDGHIEILGLDPVADNAQLRERIGVMLQGGGGYPAAKAGEMLNLVASYAADPLDPAWLMDTLGLTDSARTTYRRLSGGQQQRLALACAVVGRPELVFLDEPTAGMDAHARIVVWELIDALRRDGVTVVLTTHHLAEAEELADRIVIIDHGVAVATGTPAELTHSGAENQLRFSAPRKLDLSLLADALPENYKATETAPGEYLVEGHIDPQVLATVTAWCARLNVLATGMRVEQRSLEDVFLDLTGRELRS